MIIYSATKQQFVDDVRLRQKARPDPRLTMTLVLQIIVTDHADNLRLSNGVQFESLVNGNRWRNRGLIQEVN